MRFKLAIAMVVVLTATSLASQPSADARTRSLFVVADSIVLGAAQEIPNSMPPGWEVVVDAKVSRSTTAGLDIVRAHRGAIDDTLVIGLGANDGGTPAVFRPRVEALLAEVADVPHVFWIEIAEVRSYYPGANAVVREAAARYDNVSIIQWSELALANPALTVADGLHLTGSGRQAMADTIVNAVAEPSVRELPAHGRADLRTRRRSFISVFRTFTRMFSQRSTPWKAAMQKLPGQRLSQTAER
ncbi:MAG: hypothetical protein V3V01_13400 [Acidimicrobiales bacterium]